MCVFFIKTLKKLLIIFFKIEVKIYVKYYHRILKNECLVHLLGRINILSIRLHQ